MKKIFLSLPMKNRSVENIEKTISKMKNIAKAMFEGEEIEFIENLSFKKVPEECNKSVWHLGEAIQKLSSANVLIAVDCPYYLHARGVDSETRIFREYGLGEYIYIPCERVISKDELKELKRKFEEEEGPKLEGCA